MEWVHSEPAPSASGEKLTSKPLVYFDEASFTFNLWLRNRRIWTMRKNTIKYPLRKLRSKRVTV